MSRVSIVVPVYHNAASLPDLLARLQALAARHPGDTFEFVCVDDGSKDDSFAVLVRLQADEPRLRVVKLSRNFGSNAALLAGLAHATGDAVATISADLQDPPETLDAMLAHWRDGKKVVLAAREGRDDPFATAFLANLFYRLFRRYAIPTMPDAGLRLLRDRPPASATSSSRSRRATPTSWASSSGSASTPAVVPFRRQEREERYGTLHVGPRPQVQVLHRLVRRVLVRADPRGLAPRAPRLRRGPPLRALHRRRATSRSTSRCRAGRRSWSSS